MIITEERQIYKVSQLNRMARLLLEQQFPAIWIEGEISNFKLYSSGHMYFSLKDEQAQISCVMFAGRNRLLTFKPADGQHVLMKAKVSLYEERGNFQILVDYMEEAGDGALKRAFELLKQKLSAEGLFETRYKKPLPELPHCIGLVTSAHGAAVHDMLITLKRRFPAIPIIIYPTQVQGQEAPAEIVKAINLANQRAECDVLIVGRGGGSLEDLQAFNTEIVARAIFASQIPIISAVGHEVDVTIADFVADVRAATPTAAAELVSPDRDAWLAEIAALQEMLIDEMHSFIQQKMQEVDWLSKRLKHPGQRLRELQTQLSMTQKTLVQAYMHAQLKYVQTVQQLAARLKHHSPQQHIAHLQHEVALLQQQLKNVMQQSQQLFRNRLLQLTTQLDSLSPLKTLNRGYAILYAEPTHQAVDSVAAVKLGDTITAQLVDGTLQCQVNVIHTEGE
jgi:exodeoxyribonuclease VII large subunit